MESTQRRRSQTTTIPSVAEPPAGSRLHLLIAHVLGGGQRIVCQLEQILRAFIPLKLINRHLLHVADEWHRGWQQLTRPLLNLSFDHIEGGIFLVYAGHDQPPVYVPGTSTPLTMILIS